MKAKCRGESAGDVPVEVKSLESHRYRVTIKPKNGDLYKFSVYYADKHVPNLPFKINLIPPLPDKVKHTTTSLPEEKGAPAYGWISFGLTLDQEWLELTAREKLLEGCK